MTKDDLIGEPQSTTEESFKALAEDAEILSSIDYAVNVLVEIETSIDDRDLNTSTITLAADKLADMIDTFLMYVECYEGDVVDIDEIIAFAGASVGSTPRSTSIH